MFPTWIQVTQEVQTNHLAFSLTSADEHDRPLGEWLGSKRGHTN